MGCRALLIGAENYGEGFGDLPAVRQDIRIIKEALSRYDVEIEEVSEEKASNATFLDTEIKKLVESGGRDDVRIIFFSGHGIQVGKEDCIVPAKVNRLDAIQSTHQRVSTDLSNLVERSDIRLVLFIIDACRNEPDMTKGISEGFGLLSHLEIQEEVRFIRFFGCASQEVAHFLKGGLNGKDVSVFSKAIADVLSSSDSPISLRGLLKKTTEYCKEIAKTHPEVPLQQPRLDHGEDFPDAQILLDLPIFTPKSSTATEALWPSFDPSRFHCVVVLSEPDSGSAQELRQLIEEAFTVPTVEQIWTAFIQAWRERELLKGGQRLFNHDYALASLSLSFQPVIEVFQSDESLDQAIRGVIEADLVVFDVTGFQPGIMFLMGVRSASRRGVSICSCGGGWKEGEPLNVPFNLQDISLSSHTPGDQKVGTDPIVDRFVNRVVMGFKQYRQQPRYLDLPAYDLLRQLGSQYEAFSIIKLEQLVLVLCPYNTATYFDNWKYISRQLQKILSWKIKLGKIWRLLDLGSPQLVSRALYEQIRRVAGCLVDWTDFNPSVFLELGVRLAVSHWGAVQIIDKDCLPGGVRAARLCPSDRNSPELEQIVTMKDRFKPIPYVMGENVMGKNVMGENSPFNEIAKQFIERNPDKDESPTYNRVYRIVFNSIDAVQETSIPVYRELQQAADGLHHRDQSREGAPQLLFHESQRVKQDGEKAALERRVAAWLYLKYRLKADKLNEEHTLRELYDSLGQLVAENLSDSDDDRALADMIVGNLKL